MDNENFETRYKYQPLISNPSQHAIRLLTLHPAHELSSPIQCDLTHAYLEAYPGFEALSYTWGSLVVLLFEYSGRDFGIRIKRVYFRVPANILYKMEFAFGLRIIGS
ncbi:hypothetical protein DL98DRAFT_508206, partial [Cadophora sp. DSE1049]